MVAVTAEHQDAGDHMMSEHLPMVFPPLLDVDDQDLLEPEGELDQIVPLHRPFQFSVWPIGPLLGHVEPMVMGVHNILSLVSS